MNRLRRTMMYVPGNNPGKLQSAGIYGADSIIFDLEDAVAVTEKDAARDLVASAVRDIRYSCEVAVRINHISTPFGHDDLRCILEAKPDMIRLPKAEYPEEIKVIADLIGRAEVKYGYPAGSIKMMASIESAQGLVNACAIAKAHPRMAAIALGGEDFIADLNTTRSEDGAELAYARSQIVVAARVARIHAIDSVSTILNDDEAFLREARMIKQLGFDGKSCVHPRQVELMHKVYTPTAKEVAQARRILDGIKLALERKSGVIAVDGKMVDGPIITRAERIIAYAAVVGMNKEDADE